MVRFSFKIMENDEKEKDEYKLRNKVIQFILARYRVNHTQL